MLKEIKNYHFVVFFCHSYQTIVNRCNINFSVEYTGTDNENGCCFYADMIFGY